LRRLDLNLVRVFVAIFETRSVTAAASRLSVAQPSVSYALARLRDAFADRLFARGPAGVLPTALAEQIYARFSQALTSIDSTLEDPQRFDPATSTRRFKVAMSDIGALFFLPLLLPALRAAAPGAELEVIQVDVDQVVGDLSSGKLDAAIGNLPGIRDATHSSKLFVEHYVCLLSQSHPKIGTRLSLDQFLQARHVLVSSPSSGHRLVEDALAERGVTRNVAVRIPHFTVLPQLLAGTDLLVTLPSRIAGVFCAHEALRVIKLPVQIPSFEVRVHWHPRYERLPAHRWFIERITGALQGL